MKLEDKGMFSTTDLKNRLLLFFANHIFSIGKRLVSGKDMLSLVVVWYLIFNSCYNMQCLYNTIAVFKQFQIIAIVIMLQSAGTFRVRQDPGRILLTIRKTRNFYFKLTDKL